ncbi:hypothetical protein LEP1GSC195_0644 [Leptospira wolbachii serovar Codice str. CDC]|uniref:Uncharacterized protein n=1 Tax=Leptospira wolbachii serovar Codice str. CDC TaxID=1218599 RepID=R9A8R1_9LEPT|nr:hypothetical protein [Leptospira wolbachii]EOQ98546.1 hypothetical protein LEP1GSC195_0644 [Leptospira wolbachii serovar Codice str. CDC]
MSLLYDHYISFFAILSCLGWISMFVAKKSGQLWLGNCMGIVYHIALAPVIQALPAPEFVRMAGYTWIFCDALIDVASINSMSEKNAWALRMGVHIPATIWIIGSSISMAPVPRSVGIVLGILLALHAIFGPKIPDSKFKLFIFVLPLMTLWLTLIAYHSF